jgi:hypothetical protein
LTIQQWRESYKKQQQEWKIKITSLVENVRENYGMQTKLNLDTKQIQKDLLDVNKIQQSLGFQFIHIENQNQNSFGIIEQDCIILF